MLLSRIAPIVTLIVSLTACSSQYEHICKSTEQLAIYDSLYFGTGKPNGVVTPEEWLEFLGASVTARFPQGLTVLRASGQWRGADGSVVREATNVLHLVHPNDVPSEKAVQEIVLDYKERFQQEAVLRVKAITSVSF